MIRPQTLLLAASLLLAPSAPAQFHAIWSHNGTSTSSGVLCGFDCTTPAATIRVPVLDPNSQPTQFGINVAGRQNALAILLASPGPVVGCQGGINIAGIKNTLVIQFPALFVNVQPLTRAYRGGGCGGGFDQMLPAIPLPSVVKGVTIGFQAVVTDDADGAVAFTKAIQVTFF